MLDPYRYVKQVLYDVKHTLPSTATIHKKSQGVVDWDTGIVSRESENFEVKVVPLPKTISNERQSDVGPFTTGLKESERVIVIDGSDLPPTLMIKPQDEVTYLGRTWVVTKARQHEGKFFELVVKDVAYD